MEERSYRAEVQTSEEGGHLAGAGIIKIIKEVAQGIGFQTSKERCPPINLVFWRNTFK